MEALHRVPQCFCELVGTEILNAVRKWERRERLEHDIVGAVAVAPVVELPTFDKRFQERNPKKYRKGIRTFAALADN
jgi:hypothetical protein